MIDERPELQRVPAAGVEDVIAPGEDILPEVRRSNVRSHLRHAADVECSDLLARHNRILRDDNPGRRRIVRMSFSRNVLRSAGEKTWSSESVAKLLRL